MELTPHDLPALFAQLGLPNDAPAIDRFIAAHGPLPLQLRLFEAPFWSPSQSSALQEMIRDDSDWAVVVDTFNTRLRAPVTQDSLVEPGTKTA
jgi:hypothetical protein